jgi:hypothetical protein
MRLQRLCRGFRRGVVRSSIVRGLRGRAVLVDRAVVRGRGLRWRPGRGVRCIRRERFRAGLVVRGVRAVRLGVRDLRRAVRGLRLARGRGWVRGRVALLVARLG